MTSFFAAAALVVRKDLLVETRSREVVYTSLLFAVSCMLVFAFGLVKEGRVVADAAAAILWITIAFAGTLALGRIFDRERHNETMRALLLAPVPRAAIYIGKFAGVVLLLLLVEAVVVPLVALMFDAPIFRHAPLVAGLMVAGSLGYAAVGTLFAAMLARSRSRGTLLPVLLYPMTVPVIIGGVRGTAALLQPDVDIAMARTWLVLLLCFDAVFLTLALWLFEPVMTE
ncbi:MAG: heme exporter protein CcmB [Acidobacteriota bacterium]|nr:heme exporter protein CcmB [Acidobacteriota bacterium]MDQ3420743.1 heme exporter protein CcmB [Acidobacteriota bacterium]